MSFITPQAPKLPNQNQDSSAFSAANNSASDDFQSFGDTLRTISNIIVEGDSALQQAASQSLANQVPDNGQDYALYQQTHKGNAKDQDVAFIKPEIATANLQQHLAQDILKQTSKKMSEKLIVSDNEGQNTMPNLSAGSDIAAAFAATVNRAEKEQQNQHENEFLHNPLQQVEAEQASSPEGEAAEESLQAPKSQNTPEDTANIAATTVQVELDDQSPVESAYQGAAKLSAQNFVNLNASTQNNEDLAAIAQAGYNVQPFTPIAADETEAVTDQSSVTEQVKANLTAQVNQHQAHLLALRSSLDELLLQTASSINFLESSDTSDTSTDTSQSNLFNPSLLKASQTNIENLKNELTVLNLDLQDIAATGVDSNSEFYRYQNLSARLQRLELNLNAIIQSSLSRLYISPFTDADGNQLSAEQVDALPAEEREAVIARQQAEDAALVIDANQSFLASAYQDLQRQLIDISTMNEEIDGVPFIATEFPLLPDTGSTLQDVQSLFSDTVTTPVYQRSNVDIYTKAEEETGEFFDAIAQFVAAFNNPDPNADKSVTLKDGTYIKDVTDLTGLTVFGHWVKLAQSLLEIVTGVYNYLVNAEKKLHSASQN